MTNRTDSSTTIVRGTVVTMNPAREVINNGGVVIDGAAIIAVGRFDDVRAAHPDAVQVGGPDDLVVPGYINGHQHLTGDRLIKSSIPDDLPPGQSIHRWVVPVHANHTGDDDELAATLTLAASLANGITWTFEAGTVAHPDRVAAAARATGARVTIGTWGWDVAGQPFAGPVDEVIGRQRDCLTLADEGLVSAWVSLVGHDLMSDELVTAAAGLAVAAGVGLTFHLSPSPADTEAYLARSGLAPVVHLDRIGVLGPQVVVAHAVHLDDDELQILLGTGTAVVSCPWAYLRLGQGVTRAFRHLDLWSAGGRVALGCDAENAGDMVDGIRTAALFAGLAKDRDLDPTVFGAHEALELLTIRGAEALGVADRVGSIEVGKQADVVVHDRRRLEWLPPSPDPVLQLIWGSDGRSVRDVWVGGRQVVADAVPAMVDIAELTHHARVAGPALLERSGINPISRW